MIEWSGNREVSREVLMAPQSFTSGKKALVGLAGLLAAASVWRACYMVSSLCANSITDDYIGVVPLVAAISSPGYHWSHFLADATSGPHCFAVPALIYAAIARTTDWDCRTELYLGIFLTTIRCFVLAATMTDKKESLRRSAVFCVLVLLSLGSSCTSVYMFGIPAMASATGLLGLALGMWAVIKMAGQTRALPLVFLGGLLSGSFGPFQTVATWLVYIFASLLMRVKNKLWYPALVCGGGLSVLLLKAMQIKSSGANPTSFSAYFFVKALNILGRSFANEIGNSVVALPQAQYAGAFGLVLLVVLLFLHWQRRTALAQLAGPLTVLAYALLGTAAVSLTRDAIASWYSLYTVLFWSSLTALGGLLLTVKSQPAHKSLPLQLVALTPLLFILIAYPFTNINYKNKDYFARDHAPAAETATRMFLTAPTYAEQSLFIPGEGNIERMKTICAPLYCMGWGAFGAHQVWALQGDYILPSVDIIPGKNSLPIAWYKSEDMRKPAEWQDPEHLKLCVDIDSRITWKVELPERAKSIKLLTEIRAGKKGAPTSRASADLFSIAVQNDVANPEFITSYGASLLKASGGAEHVEMDLTRYKGQRIAISIAGCRSQAGQPGLFEYPRLEIETVPERHPLSDIEGLKMKPANTDLSEQYPVYTDQDLVFDVADEKLWRQENIERAKDDPHQLHLTGKGLGALTLAPAFSVNENDYRYFAFGLDVPPQVKPRVFCLQIIINGSELRNVLVPLLPEGGMHKYAYDLKLLNLDPTKQQITALKLLPLYQVKDGDVRLTELRFIRRKP